MDGPALGVAFLSSCGAGLKLSPRGPKAGGSAFVFMAKARSPGCAIALANGAIAAMPATTPELRRKRRRSSLAFFISDAIVVTSGAANIHPLAPGLECHHEGRRPRRALRAPEDFAGDLLFASQPPLPLFLQVHILRDLLLRVA